MRDSSLTEHPLLGDLNPEQRKAVTTVSGPVLVIAGAGSGKTRVLTYRVAYLIEALGVPPENILAVTFTNKAANEMRTRIENLLNINTRGLFIGTFHSICVRILRANIDYLPYDKNFSIFDRDDQLRVVKKLLEEIKSRETPKRLLHHIQKIKAGHEPESDWHYEFFKKYQQKLLELNAMDFDDLLINTRKLFEEHREVKNFYAEKFMYIHVDEYQDTNRIQYELLRHLSSTHGNIFVVGDDDQSIYSFRGADIRNILHFERDFPNATIIRLERNYRSTKNILKAASVLIANNTMRKGKTLWTDGPEGDKLIVHESFNEREEAEFVAGKIEEFGRPFSRNLILYRTNAQSRIFEEVFNKRGLPYIIVGAIKFFERKEIKDLIAYLKLILNPKDDISFLRIVNTPHRGIGVKTIKHLSDYAIEEGLHLLEAIPGFVEYKGTKYIKLKRFYDLIARYIKMKEKKEDVFSILHDLINTLEFEEYIKKTYSGQEAREKVEGRIENVNALLGMAQEFVISQNDPTLENFMEHISVQTEQDDMDIEQKDRITIMTVHNAKGLEFENVFITGMEDGVFPHKSALSTTYELEEERRLFHVAITRAKKRVIITYAKERSIRFGEFLSPSRFLDELPEDVIIFDSVTKRYKDNQKDKENDEKRQQTELHRGDYVYHPMFGRGRILVKNGDKVKVLFTDGIKTLSLKFANLVKTR